MHAFSDKLKVSHSLTSGGTLFVVYIVHPMCSDGYTKNSVFISKIVVSKMK